MCREVSILYGPCMHEQTIKLTGWCSHRNFIRRVHLRKPCEMAHSFIAASSCHSCACLCQNWYVDQMRKKLAELWTAASQFRLRRDLLHTRERFKACRTAVVDLWMAFEDFVAEHNDDGPFAFDTWVLEDFTRDPLADGRPVRRPVLPLLVGPDLQSWLDQRDARADAGRMHRCSLGDPDSGAEDGDEDYDEVEDDDEDDDEE
ncbi:MAG: hypothetical protein M1826_002028 [Phylliscum demangeonii]|nr:MAG: hypothetical protein M1826_002028 [Phylliscum demangeonii]